jgi:hypothetical protein
MATQTISVGGIQQEERVSWIPMISIALGQMIISFNVASLPVAMGGMVTSFGVARPRSRRGSWRTPCWSRAS